MLQFSSKRLLHQVDVWIHHIGRSAAQQRIRQCFFEDYDDAYASPIGSTLSDIFIADLNDSDNGEIIASEVLRNLQSTIKEERCIAILGMMGLSFHISRSRKTVPSNNISDKIFAIMLDVLNSNDPHYHFAI